MILAMMASAPAWSYSTSALDLPTWRVRSSTMSIVAVFASCALPMASRITSSETSLAPASTIKMASRELLTTMLSVLSLVCS